MKHRLARTSLAATIAVTALGLSAGSAAAQPVTCGAVLTHDTRLDNDVTGCTGPGLVIGADRITVNLNGHRVAGAGFVHAPGIDNTGGYDRVVIRNGEVSGFESGVSLVGARRNLVKALSIPDADTGISLTDSDQNEIRRNTVQSGFGAIVLRGSDRNDIVDNTFPRAGAGVDLQNSNGNWVARNVQARGGQGFMVATSNHNLVERNTVTRTFFAGIALLSGKGNVLRANTTNENDDGIFVGADARNSLVRGNVANNNLSNGIRIRSPRTLVARNTASFNGFLGIDAVAGTRDGGGNQATGNGDPRQCVNVSCSGP